MKIRLKNPKANLEQFAKFLMERVRLAPPPPQTHRTNDQQLDSKNRFTKKASGKLFTHNEASNVGKSGVKSLSCEGNHSTTKCFKFAKESVESRQTFVSNNNICASCLNSKDHGWRECPIQKKCGTNECWMNHNPLLHNEKRFTVYAHQARRTAPRRQKANDGGNDRRNDVAPERPAPERPQVEVPEHAELNLSHQSNKTQRRSAVLFKVVPIELLGENGVVIKTHVFMDDGSSLTLMDKNLFHELGLAGKSEKLTLQWTNKITRTEDSFRTDIVLSGAKNKKVHRLTGVYTVSDLALPMQNVDANELRRHYPHLRGIPIEGMVNVRPRILIGLSHAKLLVGTKLRCGGDNDPVAIKTLLGWTVFGRSAPSLNIVALNVEVTHRICHMSFSEPAKVSEDLHDMVNEYFTTESFGVTAPKGTADALMTDEERRGAALITQTMKFRDGRTEIGLLWKSDDVELPDSYAMASRRLVSQEKSLAKRPELLKWTNQHVEGMLEKRHARVATERDLQTPWKRIAYIPGFTIVNENKVPPKPRFVFDYAAKVGSPGTSVNSQLLKGPDNLVPLLSGLCKFRENAIAVNADVKEMYHQILIADEDQQCQRFLWRGGDQTKKPTIFILQVMAFGPTCSPSSAQAVKNANARLFEESCPEAAKAIMETTYVDDYFNSHDDVETAIRVSNDAIKIFANISFPLVGFQSNSAALLSALPQDHVKEETVCLDSDDSMVAKILGMYWEPKADVFTYKLNTNHMIPKMLDEKYHPTKREVVCTVMKVFDPLGLIAHYTIRGRLVVQEI